MTREIRRLMIPGSGTYMVNDHEYEIFRLVALGYTSDEIAPKIGRTSATVEEWRRQLMRKLRITKRHELVDMAIRAGVFREEAWR